MELPANSPLPRGLVLRGLGFAVAVALGVISVWLIVTRSSVSGQRIGALAGFWGLLLGASALSVGRRAPHHEPVDEPAPAAANGPSDAAAAAAAAVAAPAAGLELRAAVEVELRAAAALERAAEADARRDFEERLTARLEGLLRQEVHQSFGQEIHSLRSEIASLRSELVEKVGGQLRLERIETTRVIGSDLEALQHEVRQLKDARDANAFGAFTSSRAITTTRPVLEPVPVPAPPAAAAPAPTAPAPREPSGPAAELQDEREPEQRPTGGPGRHLNGAPRGDDFAALPRLTPFTDFELDLADVPGGALPAHTASRPTQSASYRGRRRAADDPPPAPEPEPAPRLAGRGVTVQAPAGARRHRQADPDDSAGPGASAG